MYRGEIWWANLSDPTDSEPDYRRPVLLIQSDVTSQTNINTIIIAILTTNLRLANVPGNVLLPRATTGLSQDSVVNVSQILTVDKSILIERVGFIQDSLQSAVDDGLRMILHL